MARVNVPAKTITAGDRINLPAVGNWEVRNVTHTDTESIFDMGTRELTFDHTDDVSLTVFSETVSDIVAMVEREGDTIVSAQYIENAMGGRTYGYCAGAIVQVNARNLTAHLAHKHTVPVLWRSNTTLSSMIRRA